MQHHPTVYARRLQIYGDTRSSQIFHRRRFEQFDSFYFQHLTAHYGCVNAVEFSNRAGNFLASGGDDKRVVLWNTTLAMLRPNYCPVTMAATHLSNIFCLAFNRTDDHLVSSGNDGQVIVHDVHNSKLVDVFMCDSSVYGLSTSPSDDHLVAGACEDGTVHIMDTRSTKAAGLCLARRSSAFHSVMFSPVDHHLIVTSHSRDGMALWDIRSPKKEVLHYAEKGSKQRAMSARFNKTGNQLLCLRRRQPLALFNICDSKSIAEFDCAGYFNSCTMKSCCFAGDKDQYIVSGSDDFGVYIWKVPDSCADKPHLVNSAFKVLRGHRSIVNQVRFNWHSNLLVSCGVEKMIKLWSTERLPFGAGTVTSDCELPRKRYSHNEYIQLILESNSGVVHDYHTENTEEDPKMLAFFDSLLQHEADERNSDSSTSDRETTIAAQRNHYFATEGGDETDSDSPHEIDRASEGPASLETLGISGASAEVPALCEAAQKRLRKLRAIINDDSNNWRVGDTTSEPTTNTPENGATKKITPTSKNKRRKRDCGSESRNPPDSSDSEDDAARMRQRNARRRARRPSQLAQRSSDSAGPGTSGLGSKSDLDGVAYTQSSNEDHKPCSS